MAKVDTLQVNVWEATFGPSDRLPVTRFRITRTAQEILTQWAREKTGRTDAQPVSVILRGLPEIAAWFAPETAFVREGWDEAMRSRRLSFFFVGEVAGDPDLRRRVQMALQLWINTLYPDKPAEMRLQVAESARADEAWEILQVGCGLRQDGAACPSPMDELFWDALAAHAVRRLAGRALTFGSGESRVLIPKTAQSSAFEGLELVAFPPNRGPRDGFWSEVITLHAATFPERGKVHLLARPSIRNWGAVTRGGSRRDPRRSLDVFLPPDENFGRAERRHTSFEFQARRGPDKPEGGAPGVVGYWPHMEDQRVFDLLRRLTNQGALAPDELSAPVVDQDGLWVLPRLASLHKDKYLPGGTGVAWPDRKDIGESLDAALAGAGFQRAEPLARRSVRKTLEKTFGKEEAAARRAVLDALAANGRTNGELSLYVFHVREATPARILDLLVERFGTPDSREGQTLRWADGLSIRVRSAPAGVLAEQLPLPEPPPEQTAGRNERQLQAIRKLAREEAHDQVVARMAAHLSAVRGNDAGVACGILEMPQALLDDARRDPFQLARRQLARHEILPQVVLADTVVQPEAEEASPPAKPKDGEKYAAAVRDCFRMLGALPVDLLPDELALGALTIVQRNQEYVGLGMRESQAIPLAIRVRQGRLECAIPDETGTPRWSPYARAALRVYQGDYGKFGRGRQAETVARYHGFFAAVLEDLDRAGPTLVIAEGETLRHKLDTLKNGELTFDRLKLGAREMTPTDLPNLRLVRVSPDPERQPFYYHEGDNKWPSGLFAWGEAARTFYGLKTKPVSVSHPQSFASMASRHGDESNNLHRTQVDVSRVSSQIDEVCVVFRQPTDDALQLATLTHRLRGAHVQTQVDTSNPFPLHELRMLAGGITF